jgi:hypothetical protein
VKYSEATDVSLITAAVLISILRETAYLWVVSLQFQFVVFLPGEA